MKFLRELVCGAVLFTGTFTVQAITLSLNPSTSITTVGSPISMDLVISGLGDHVAPSLGTFDLEVSFDAALFSLTNVNFASNLGDPNPAANETDITLDTSTTGVAKLYEVSLLEANVTTCFFCVPPYLEDLQSSTFTLASLSFNSIAPGNGIFGMTINTLGDAFANSLTANSQGTSVTANPSTSVPEPNSLALCVLGLLVMGFGFKCELWSDRQRL